MGVQYGNLVSSQMKEVLLIYNDYYVKEHKAKYTEIVEIAKDLYYKFPLSVQQMILGISAGSEISINDCYVLSAMQFISPYFVPDSDNVQCSFVSVDKSRCKNGYPIIGRFFDLFKPFERVVKYLTVVIFPKSSMGGREFITVGFPGEIHCLTCFNDLGLFLEVNNGGASGGKEVYWDREYMPGRYFEIIAQSFDIFQMYYELNSIKPDFSWITNFADVKEKLVYSFEFSSKFDVAKMGEKSETDFVVTNYFVNSTWKNIPKPTDEKTWHGVTRRKNLQNLIKNSLPERNIDISTFLSKVMDVKIEDGGAMWNETVYQTVYDQENLLLYVRAPHIDLDWKEINFNYFN